MKSNAKKKSIKKLAVVAMISVLTLVLTVTGIFICFFVNPIEDRETIVIPDLVGKEFAAIGHFDRIKIDCEPIYSDDIPEGKIISQFPCGGSKRKVPEGQKYSVRLTVSLGKESQSIPDLRGFRYIDAASALRTIGARIRVVSIFDDGVERDLVLRTSPTAGERIVKGDLVTLFVSRNHIKKTICVKDYVGMPLDLASAEILAEGLSLGEIVRKCSDQYPENTVISQSIAKNDLVPSGSRIDITISTGTVKEEIHPFRGYMPEEIGGVHEFRDRTPKKTER